MDIIKYNRIAWDNYVEKQDRWTIPVSERDLEEARNGNWNVVLTPTKSVPHHWFPPLVGLKILGLASGGGQQGPILAALGADVTIFDNSEKQLFQDISLSTKFQLGIKPVQGDMRDLSVFDDNAFDLIFNPCSILFIDHVRMVWKECFRVLKPNGILMSGLINPISFQVEEMHGDFKLVYKQPYSDLNSLSAEKLDDLVKSNEALVFGHPLTEQIGGQLEAGFILTHMYEDDWNGENEIDKYFPSFISTRAIKAVK